jgi:hypothetical protein
MGFPLSVICSGHPIELDKPHILALAAETGFLLFKVQVPLKFNDYLGGAAAADNNLVGPAGPCLHCASLAVHGLWGGRGGVGRGGPGGWNLGEKGGWGRVAWGRGGRSASTLSQRFTFPAPNGMGAVG